MSKLSATEPITVGHDEDSNLIWVNEFNESSARQFVEDVLKASAKDPKKPIVIYIDSPGGNVDSLASMVTAIDSVPNQIVTVCMGSAMSAGAMLLSHGDVRYVAPMGRVMVHEISAGVWGNVNDLKNETQEMERLAKLWMKWLADNCKLTVKQLTKKFTNEKREIYLSANEAVEFGIADKVGVPTLKQVITYELG